MVLKVLDVLDVVEVQDLISLATMRHIGVALCAPQLLLGRLLGGAEAVFVTWLLHVTSGSLLLHFILRVEGGLVVCQLLVKHFLPFLWRNCWLCMSLVIIDVGAVALGKDLDRLGLAVFCLDL